ncbi:hypothetical protein EXS71_04150 [Candidatus Uhrbacteria bacterium]|nr:hypothetical protein [Candidatus Uhrbacteria bacterium]
MPVQRAEEPVAAKPSSDKLITVGSESVNGRVMVGDRPLSFCLIIKVRDGRCLTRGIPSNTGKTVELHQLVRLLGKDIEARLIKLADSHDSPVAKGMAATHLECIVTRLREAWGLKELLEVKLQSAGWIIPDKIDPPAMEDLGLPEFQVMTDSGLLRLGMSATEKAAITPDGRMGSILGPVDEASFAALVEHPERKTLIGLPSLKQVSRGGK